MARLDIECRFLSRVEGRGSRVTFRGSRLRVEVEGKKVKKVKKVNIPSYIKLIYNVNRAVRLFSTFSPCACCVSV